MFTLSFDPDALKAITGMYGFPVLLSPEVQQAMQQGGDLLTKAAQDNTWRVFENPSGNLASQIHPVVQSPYEIQITAGAPHSRRRERGFTGMTDRLGRYFAFDPPKPYLQPAMEEHQQEVLQLLDDAVDRALARMGAH